MTLLNERTGVEELVEYLSGFSVTAIRVSPFEDYLAVDMPVATVEQLLGAACFEFEHSLHSEVHHIAVDMLSTFSDGPFQGLPSSLPAGIVQRLAFVSGAALLPDAQALSATLSNRKRRLSVPSDEPMFLRNGTLNPLRPSSLPKAARNFSAQFRSRQSRGVKDSNTSKRANADTVSSEVKIFTANNVVFLYIPLNCVDGSRSVPSEGHTLPFSCTDGSQLEYIRVSYTPQNGKTNYLSAYTETLWYDYISCYGIISIATENFVPYAYTFDISWGGKWASVLFPWVSVSAPEVYPDFIKGFYGTTDFIGSHPRNLQAIGAINLGAGSAGYYDPEDLRDFYAFANVSASNAALVSFVCTTGCRNRPDSPDQETQLDVQLITGLGPGIRTIIYHSSLSATFPIEELLMEIQNDPNPPLVISFSYGSSEKAYAALGFLEFTNDLLKAMGIMGITVVVASGDQGAYMHGSRCEDGFDPVFPASSPWVLSVGATQLIAADESGCPYESVASLDWGSLVTGGGGFSSQLAQPWYQRVAVGAYTDPRGQCRDRLPPTSMFNTSNRGYPDVSHFGHSVVMFHRGIVNIIDGTSASAPALVCVCMIVGIVCMLM